MSLDVHPAAELFPLMVGAEYEALVEDIRANGQREPGKTVDGKLIDGRNRERACADAGIEFVTVPVDLNGDDPVAYVVSLNVRRRNLNASQRAIAAAQASELFTRFGNAERQRLSRLFGTNEKYLANGRALVERDPVAAEAVKAGDRHLLDAYDELQKRERAQQTQTEKMTRLRDERPDLAERVDAEAVTVDEALDLAEADERRERDQAQVARDQLVRAVRVLADEPDNAEALLDRLERYDAPFPTPASECRLALAFLAVIADRQEATE